MGRNPKQKSKRTPTETRSHSDSCAAAAVLMSSCRTKEKMKGWITTRRHIVFTFMQYRCPNRQSKQWLWPVLQHKHTARHCCDATALGCWLKIKSWRNDTHFFPEGQSGDDIAGCHSEVFREIHRAAVVAHQNLTGKTSCTLSVCVVTLEIPQH